MKNHKLFPLLQALENLKSVKATLFALKVVRNYNLVKNEIQLLEEVAKPSDSFIEFQQKRIELCKVHSEKDNEGNPKIENRNFVIEDIEKFQLEFDKLREEYNSVIEENVKQELEYKELLEKEAEVKLKNFTLEELPEDLDANTIEALEPILIVD